jgi:hypothetical protein
MKKIYFLTLALLWSVCALQAQSTKKVLFLGNSYTYYSSLPSIIEQLALSNGDVLIHDNNTPGGYSLSQHATNATSLAKLNSNNWDHVVLQDQSLKPAYTPIEFYAGAEELLKLINPSSSCLNKAIFYMTWGRKNNTNYPYYTHQQLTTNSYNKVADIFDTEISPVGVAWKKVRDDNDPINLYDSDGSHPSYAGSYLAACVFYATIFDKSPVGLSFTGSLSSANAAYLQQKAFEAYNEYVALGLIHAGTTPDMVSDVYRAKINNTVDELNGLIAGSALATSFDFSYTGFSAQANVNATLEYVIRQGGTMVKRDSVLISETIPINQCVHQTTIYPLTFDLTNVSNGLFSIEILLEGYLIAEYDLFNAQSTPVYKVTDEDLFHCFPNPATHQIQIQADAPMDELSIFDITGKKMIHSISKENNTSVDVANLKSGLYILQVRIGEKISIKKLSIH